MTSGLIYSSFSNRPSGVVYLDLPQSPFRKRALYEFRDHRKIVSAPLRFLSYALFLIGSAGMLLTMLPVAAMEIQYQYRSYTTNRTYMPAPPAVQDVGPKTDLEAFSISIPKIDAHSVVIPNIDASDPNVYMPALQKGIAHALGSGLPGVESPINRTIYLFAHSTSAPWLVTKYNAQFYLLNKMEVGDDIDVTFWAKQYRYRVIETRVAPPTDTSFLERQTEKELLVLVTCTPAGTTKNRLLVIAERVN